LLIDVGTNGEAVLSSNGVALVCSTAAGPAFEGASVYQGMRASPGAIEGVSICDGSINLSVVGGVDPAGICGSGIIDVASELLKSGLMDKTGKLLPSGRRRIGKSGKEFVLTNEGSGGGIVVTQKDILEVQLAKAAVRAGINILMSKSGLNERNLDNIYIAGAFGSHIRTSSAVNIGLVPDIPEEKILNIGNSAGVGAAMALLSKEAKGEAVRAAKEARHVELAKEPSFQEVYLAAMAF
jgi:uncharacterized 2Fe-2S/4Fe-4S cluster protein (DUF4445 family)